MNAGVQTAPVVVIGSGCIGAAIAYHLGRLGVKGVVVVGTPNGDNERAIERYGCSPVIGRVPLLEVINRATLLEVFHREFDRGKFD